MDYRQTISWQQLITLVPKLARLADELPSGEDQGLRRHLLDMIVDLPAAVAADLQDSGQRRRDQVTRLGVILEITEAVYPAIDAGEAVQLFQELEGRLLSAEFAQPVPPPAAADSPEDEEPEAGQEPSVNV